jgi:DNA-binding beta-propeller fold protein YncE
MKKRTSKFHAIRSFCAATVIAVALTILCSAQPPQAQRMTGNLVEQSLLPTGAHLDPAGRSFDVGNMPLSMLLSPEGDRIIILLSGWREEGLQVVERSTGRVTQTLKQPAAFLGLAFSPDGKTLYASGGDEDVVYRYAWRDRKATLTDSLVLAQKDPKKNGTRYPAGLALSRDGRLLYVAENVSGALAVIDVESKRVIERHQTDRYPYGVVVAPDGTVYVSAWGSNSVSIFSADATGKLTDSGKVIVGRHPSALLLNHDGSRLFVASASTDRVAVVDTKRQRVIANLLDPSPSGLGEGSTPNALALSSDGTRLFVAEADNNAVAVFELSRVTSGAKAATGKDRLAGRMPSGWYPTALIADGESLFALNGKGRGTGPNPKEPQADKEVTDQTTYTLGQLNGTLTLLPASARGVELTRLTERVTRANGWDRTRTRPSYPPFKHVIYIIKENRTYDQVFGDLPQGDGDASLLFFPRAVSPNHHALAERFGLFDRFFVNAEVSQQGHPWSTSAYVTDYTEKTTPLLYSYRRADVDEGEADEPATGFLWNSALKKGLTLRNYGEYGEPVKSDTANPNAPVRYHSIKPTLSPYTNPDYPSFNPAIQDQRRADVWIEELRGFVKTGKMPALEILHLPNDHTAGGRAGRPTPKAYMADNDLALGRMVEALSKTPFWKDTVFFVLEDDAQDGPDHVDSHRSVLLVISAYNRGGVSHRFVNTTDVVATIDEILGLEPLSQFDHFGRPLREMFKASPDLRPFEALTPSQSLTEMNPPQGKSARESLRLDLSKVDVANEALFNRILWRVIKGDEVPYPETRRISSLEYTRSR